MRYQKVDFNQKYIRTAGIETPIPFDRTNKEEVNKLIDQFLNKAKRSGDLIDVIKLKMYEKGITAAIVRKSLNMQKSHLSETLAKIKPLSPNNAVKIYKLLDIDPKLIMDYLANQKE